MSMSSHKNAMTITSKERYQPFPRSAILTVIFAVLSSRLDVVDVSASTESIDMTELESFGSTELDSAGALEFETACG
jgi:hypothetical protein